MEKYTVNVSVEVDTMALKFFATADVTTYLSICLCNKHSDKKLAYYVFHFFLMAPICWLILRNYKIYLC